MHHRALAFLCFFLSGTTGLIYEIVWIRLLGGTIGNTHFSITVVVSVFMAGLALGSYCGGRVADRSPNPLRLYGILMLLVGLSCALVPLAVEAARPLFDALYDSFDGRPEAAPLLAVKLAFAAVILLVPTSFMGATLPTLSRHLTRSLGEVGGTVGALYAINTLGAVIGAFLTGFFGIRHLGVWGCIGVAVGLDAMIGVVVILSSRGRSLPAPAQPEAASRRASSEAATVPSEAQLEIRWALLGFGLAGFADMLLQIAWTKAIVLSIGNSTYAFSLIVTLFILGIAIGGGLVAAFVDRVQNQLRLLGILIFATGACVSTTIPLLGHMPILASRWFDSVEEASYLKFLWIQVFLVAVVILPSTTLMGTIFPVVGKIRARSLERVGSAVGSAYLWNTAGSILGTLAAGFVFIPLFGRVFYTLYLGAGLSLIMGSALVAAASRRSAPLRLFLAAGLVAAATLPQLFFLPHGLLGSEAHYWHPSIMSRGAYVYYEHTYRGPSGEVIPEDVLIDGLLRENKILYYKEGIHAPVAVVQNTKGEMAMRIAGKVEASLAPGGGYNSDLPHQVLAGHLPMILHPEPKSVVTLGLGGGVTLGTLTLYPVERIDSLEISQEVIDAARDFFGSANHGALVNPRVRNVVGDGRSHIEYTEARYDVMTSVPSNPWIAGIGNLFTVQFFRACREHLAPGGVLCNWIHKVNMRSEDLRAVVRTFLEVFGDHAQLWDLGYDALLIGSNAPIRFDASRLERLLENPLIAGDLSGLGIRSPETLLRHYHLDAKDMRRYAGAQGPVNTDTYPILEFDCPQGLYGHAMEGLDSMALAERSPFEGGWVAGLDPARLAEAQKLREAFRRYQGGFALAHELTVLQRRQGTASGPALATLRQSVGELSTRVLQYIRWIEEATRDGQDMWLRERAIDLVVNVALCARQATLEGTLARAYLDAAKAPVPAETKIASLALAAPYTRTSVALLQELGMQALSLGSPQTALPIVEEAARASPGNADLLLLQGLMLGASGNLEGSLPVFDRALEAAASAELRSQILQNKGYALQLAKRPKEALLAYEEALRQNPENAQARARAGDLRRQLGGGG